jgi:hypothetical protein
MTQRIYDSTCNSSLIGKREKGNTLPGMFFANKIHTNLLTGHPFTISFSIKSGVSEHNFKKCGKQE